jgi:threonine dehydrogenase-like Zn-dependent dehydrogenase
VNLVVMPFAYSDGTCAFCHEVLQTACVHVGFFGNSGFNGAQAEALRVPFADGTLFPLPVGEDHQLMPSLLTLSDVMGTGHHAAVVAGVKPGDTVAERGDEAVARVRELTGGFGVHAVLECVGTEASTQTSVEIARPGGAVGRVGVPHYPAIPQAQPMFFKNVKVGGGPAPVRAYIDELLPDILEGKIEPGRVFDRTVGLDGVPDGYRAMAQRESIKVLVTP